MPGVYALLSISFRKAIGPLLSSLLDSLSLRPHQLLYPTAPELQQFVHLFAREWRTFGARILVIFQIKQRRSVNDSDADRGYFSDDGRLLNPVFFQQPPAGNRESHIRAGDGRGARAAVRL